MPTEGSSPARSRVIVGLLAVLATIAAIWFLEITYAVTMPLAFAFFLATMVYPIQKWLEKRLPKKLSWLGNLAAMLTVLLALAIMVLLIYAIVATIVNAAPRYADKLSGIWDDLANWLERRDIYVRRQLIDSEKVISLATTMVPLVWEALIISTLVFIYAMMMLQEIRQWSRKSDITLDHRVPVSEAVQDVASRVRAYLQSVTIISVISGTCHGLFQGLMGIDMWYIWGLLMLVMNYIPNIGTMLAFIPPLIVSLVQHGVWWTLLVLIGMIIVETVVAYIIAPRIHGKAQSLSPLVIVISIVFWGWLWGVVGAFLAVPLTVTLVAFFERTPSLRPLALLLSHEVRRRGSLKKQIPPENPKS